MVVSKEWNGSKKVRVSRSKRKIKEVQYRWDGREGVGGRRVRMIVAPWEDDRVSPLKVHCVTSRLRMWHPMVCLINSGRGGGVDG